MVAAKKKTTQMLKVKAKAQAAAAPKQTRKLVRQKVKTYITFIILHRNVRSLNSSERFEELTQEVEGCRCGAILISERWRASNAEIWETQQGHIFMESGNFEKHGVGILVNKKWWKHMNWTDYISERANCRSIGKHDFQKEEHENCGRRRQCRIGRRFWS